MGPSFLATGPILPERQDAMCLSISATSPFAWWWWWGNGPNPANWEGPVGSGFCQLPNRFSISNPANGELLHYIAMAVIRWSSWTGPRMAPDCPQEAQGHPTAGLNCGKSSTGKYLHFAGVSTVSHSWIVFPQL